jgi:UDP-N-acetylmuramate--alanine ligase
MRIFFSGIGGTGIGPLSLIAHQAGFDVCGSDKQHSNYIDYLQARGVTDIQIGQSYEQIAKVHAETPIDWYVYSSAITKEQGAKPDELRFCEEHNIKTSRRDELLNEIMQQKNLKLIAIAGTHGKTTTTAMTVWLFTRLGISESHSVAAKMSFAEMGQYTPGSEYFIYEADEYDRNFLAYHPEATMITGIDWDHPDVFPTRESYNEAFHQFLGQSKHITIWDADVTRLKVTPAENYTVIKEADPAIAEQLHLPGLVNRLNAWLVANSIHELTGKPLDELLGHLNDFPGVGRRFETIAPNIISDYAHTPPKIRGALQTAEEAAGQNVVVVYEGLHNTRQHFIKDELVHLFDGVKQLYIVPSYLAREDKSLKMLAPADLKELMGDTTKSHAEPAELNDALAGHISSHVAAGDLVLCISAGGGGSLDEWVRQKFGAR